MNMINIGMFDCLFDSFEIEGMFCWVYFVFDRWNGDFCYKDGVELFFFDFNRNCFINGWCVIFYNEMIRNNYFVGYEIELVLIEMCEVIVMGIVFIRVFLNLF